MNSYNNFNGKNILVTGAGSGIGKEVTLLLVSLGAHVVAVGRDSDKLKELSILVPEGTIDCISFDLCDFNNYDDLFEHCLTAGKLDGLVHCAGIAQATPIKALSVSNIDRLFDVNFKSFVFLVKFFSKKKYSNDYASIVACSAVNVHYPQKYMSIYEATKGALEVVSKGFAEELYVSRKQRVNTLVIGPVVTPMAGFTAGDFSAVGEMSDITPNLMGMAHPNSIAKMAAFLLSNDSNYTTGRKFYVDGGRF